MAMVVVITVTFFIGALVYMVGISNENGSGAFPDERETS
jgi:hypothetical protein